MGYNDKSYSAESQISNNSMIEHNDDMSKATHRKDGSVVINELSKDGHKYGNSQIYDGHLYSDGDHESESRSDGDDFDH